MKVNAYKFVTWEVPALESHKGSFSYTMMEKLNNGENLTREEKNKLAACICHDGVTKSMGFRFDFRNAVKNYVVKQYGSWHEYFAPDKTSLRKVLSGRIQKIVEVA